MTILVGQFIAQVESGISLLFQPLGLNVKIFYSDLPIALPHPELFI
jgi:hypothetical protein